LPLDRNHITWWSCV